MEFKYILFDFKKATKNLRNMQKTGELSRLPPIISLSANQKIQENFLFDGNRIIIFQTFS